MSENLLQKDRTPASAVFDPDGIDLGLCRDLPGTLRALADAIDTGKLEATYPQAEGVGGPRHDHRAHVRVSFVVAAEVFPREKDLP